MALQRFQLNVDGRTEITVDNEFNRITRLKTDAPLDPIEHKLAEKLLETCLPIKLDQRLMHAIANFPFRLKWSSFLVFKESFEAEDVLIPGEVSLTILIDKPELKGLYLQQMFEKYFEKYYNDLIGEQDVRNTSWGKKYNILSKQEVIQIILPYVLVLDLGKHHARYRKALNVIETYQIEFAKFVMEKCNTLPLTQRQENAAKTFPFPEIWNKVIRHGEKAEHNLIDIAELKPTDRKKNYEEFLEKYCKKLLKACTDPRRDPKISAWIKQWQPPLKTSEFCNTILPRIIALDAATQLPELRKNLREVAFQEHIPITETFKPATEQKSVPPLKNLTRTNSSPLPRIAETPEPKETLPTKKGSKIVTIVTPKSTTSTTVATPSSAISSLPSEGAHSSGHASSSSNFLTTEVLATVAGYGGRIEIVSHPDGATTHAFIFPTPPAASNASLKSLEEHIDSLSKALVTSPIGNPVKVSKTGLFKENYVPGQDTHGPKVAEAPSTKAPPVATSNNFWNSMTRAFKKASGVAENAAQTALRR